MSNQSQHSDIVEIDNPEQYTLSGKSDLPSIPNIAWTVANTHEKTEYIPGRLASKPADDSTTPPHGEVLVNAVTKGAKEYINSYGIETINIPNYFGQISKFEPVINTWTTSADGIGYGIDQSMLRGLLRLTDEFGQIDPETTVIICKRSR